MREDVWISSSTGWLGEGGTKGVVRQTISWDRITMSRSFGRYRSLCASNVANRSMGAAGFVGITGRSFILDNNVCGESAGKKVAGTIPNHVRESNNSCIGVPPYTFGVRSLIAEKIEDGSSGMDVFRRACRVCLRRSDHLVGLIGISVSSNPSCFRKCRREEKP